MDQLITIATFQYPHEVHIIRSKLEAAGIEVFLKDELTVQSHNFLSNAVGGIKLQVKASDVPMGGRLLKEMGVNVQFEEESKGYFDWIDAKTNQIPILRNWTVEFRVIAMVALILIPILLLVFIAQMQQPKAEVNSFTERAKVGRIYELNNQHLPHIDSLLDAAPLQAINYARDLLENDYPQNRKLYYKLGYGYISIDSFSLAKEYIGASMDFDYPEKDKLRALAYCYFKLKNYEEAIQIYTDLIADDYTYKVSLAEAYLYQKDYENAVRHYSEYIKESREKNSNSYKDKQLFEIILRRDSVKSLIP